MPNPPIADNHVAGADLGRSPRRRPGELEIQGGRRNVVERQHHPASVDLWRGPRAVEGMGCDPGRQGWEGRSVLGTPSGSK